MLEAIYIQRFKSYFIIGKNQKEVQYLKLVHLIILQSKMSNKIPNHKTLQITWIITYGLAQLSFKIAQRMCGNDISTIADPNGISRTSLKQIIQAQIHTKRISLNNVPLQNNQIMLLRTINTMNVRQIDLEKCGITHEGLDQFVKCNFTNLQRLNLNNNQIGPIGCRVIAQTQAFIALKCLQLNNNKVKDLGLQTLTKSKFRGRLQDLCLNQNGITNNGIGNLSRCFPKMDCFSIAGNKLNDESIQILKTNINMSRLIYLKLSRNQITQVGLRNLLQNENDQLKSLSVLLIQRNKIKQDLKKDQLLQEGTNINPELFLFY